MAGLTTAQAMMAMAATTAVSENVKRNTAPDVSLKPKTAPVADDEERKRAAQRLASSSRSEGRAGTMLTGNESKLG